jgi:GNAT superfamily N-acetyltransferase
MSMTRLVFSTYDKDSDKDAKDLFLKYPHKDYQLKFMGLTKNKMLEYLQKTLTMKNTGAICLRDAGELIGLVGLEAMPWMSEHFNMRMFAINHLLAKNGDPLALSRLLRYVVEELAHVDFLDCRVAVDDVRAANALESSGFRYVGVEIYLCGHIKDIAEPHIPRGVEIGPPKADEMEDLTRMCGEIHYHNRFIYDPVITDASARSLYGRLFKRCFDHEDFRVLVARTNSGPVGYMVTKVNPYFSSVMGVDCGSLAFAGVKPGNRRNGLGAALGKRALCDLSQQGVKVVATRLLASNYQALQTAMKLGFKVTSSSLHFHRWVQRPTTPIPPSVHEAR